MQVFEGTYSGQGRQICIAVSRFNDLVSSRLLEGAIDGLERHGVRREDIAIIKVPGAWELPLVLKRAMAARKGDGSVRFDAAIALGAVIRGESAHFDLVCAEVSKGIASIGMESGRPVIFGVLTCNHLQEAMERAGGKAGNKGFDAALACLEMVNVGEALDALA